MSIELHVQTLFVLLRRGHFVLAVVGVVVVCCAQYLYILLFGTWCRGIEVL